MTTKAKTVPVDPLNVNSRLYSQIGKLLDDLESADRDSILTTPQRIGALKAIAQIMILQETLRKAIADDPTRAGSSVRKYSTAFKTNAARRRAANAGSAADAARAALSYSIGNSEDD